MINIIIDKRIRSIRDQFLVYLKEFLRYNEKTKSKKAKSAFHDKILKIHYRKRNLTSKMFKFLHKNLDKIILLDSESLEGYYHDSFIKNKTISYNTNDSQHKIYMNRFKEGMMKFYEEFMQYEISDKQITVGYWLSKELNIKVCPYCNHHYVFTIYQGKKNVMSRPQFDHFLPKSDFPLFALSFYNLVPSCGVCNKIKGNKKISCSPYSIKNNDITFSLKGAENELLDLDKLFEKNNLKIHVRSTNGSTNIKELGLDKVYENHLDYVSTLLDKVQAYNKSHYDVLIRDFKGLGRTPEEIDTIIFGGYLEENEKQPMSKFTSDILKELNIK